MPTFAHLARRIARHLDANPDDADRIRALLPPTLAAPAPTPRKRAAAKTAEPAPATGFKTSAAHVVSPPKDAP